MKTVLDMMPTTNRQAGYSQWHYAVGTIPYPTDQLSGYLLRVKVSDQ